jgi:predicted permease
VRLATALYRRAATVLPKEFRTEYLVELTACFERIVAEARGRSRLGGVAVAGVTVRSILDLFTRAPKQHLAAARAGVLAPTGGWAGTWADLRHAARRLRRRPSFTVASVATLALGIAAATSVFTLVHGVVLSPLPYPDSDRIVQVDYAATKLGMPRGLGVTYGFYRFYRKHAPSAAAMAMYDGTDLTLTGRGEPVRLDGVRATPSLAAVLGVAPRLGRWFTDEEGREGAAPVVVLSDRIWRERFGAAPAVLGERADLGGVPYQVVGVMGPGFAFPSEETAFWVPRAVPATGVGGFNEKAVARLAPGARPADLEREMTSLVPLLRETTDDPGRIAAYLDEAGVVPRIMALKEEVVGEVRSTLWILLGTVGLVLAIAVANVTNLFLVRAEEAGRETAVRTALGAGGARVVRGFLAESTMLAVVAGALGTAGAAAAVRVLRLRAPVDIPRLSEVHLDATAAGVAVAITLAAALLVGLGAALRRRGALAAELKAGGGRATAGRRLLRGRNVLVAAQVALALVLLIGSGLLLRSFAGLRAVDLGFGQRRALVFDLGLPGSRYPDRAAARSFHDRLLARLRALPGVGSAAAVGPCLPLSGFLCWGETLEAEGAPTPKGQSPPVLGTRVVTTGYFQTLGIPVRGRRFTAADETTGAPAAILSESAARAYFGKGDPIGRRIRFGADEPWHTVVGVAGDVRARVASDDFERLLYLRDRRAAGPGRPCRHGGRDGLPARRRGGRRRRRDRPRRRPRPHPVPGRHALRRRPRRPGELRGAHRRDAGGRRPRALAPGPPRLARRSPGGPAQRLSLRGPGAVGGKTLCE